jgi:hypothetical protein
VERTHAHIHLIHHAAQDNKEILPMCVNHAQLVNLVVLELDPAKLAPLVTPVLQEPLSVSSVVLLTAITAH